MSKFRDDFIYKKTYRVRVNLEDYEAQIEN